MTISIRIEPGSGVAVVGCSGVLGAADARQAAAALWQTPDWPGTSAVWDFRASQFDLSTAEVRRVAEFILEDQRKLPPAKMAFVTPREVDFGLARMFQAYRDDPRTAFRVFRDYDEALVWARSQGA